MDKLSLKDITKNNKLSSKEILEMKEMVDVVNKFVEENPEYMEYLRKRYPKNDPRLSELNYKMDQMMSASREYMDTHFPENVSVFERLKKIINKNIQLTDPKNFKNVSDPVTIKHVTREKSPARFFKKEKKKDTSRTRWLKGA